MDMKSLRQRHPVSVALKYLESANKTLGEPASDQGGLRDPGKVAGSRFSRAGKSVKLPELPSQLRRGLHEISDPIYGNCSFSRL